MTVSNIQQMFESSEVEGGGATAAVRSTYALAEGSHVEERGGGATPEDNPTIEHLELALI